MSIYTQEYKTTRRKILDCLITTQKKYVSQGHKGVGGIVIFALVPLWVRSRVGKKNIKN